MFYQLMILLASFTFANNLQNPYCRLSCKSGENIYTNTVCKRSNIKCGAGPKCGPDFKPIKMTNYRREYVLDLHNKLRNKVARGLEKRNNQPAASNMNVLIYDKELEFLAQCWANECNGKPLQHDKCRRTEQFKAVGQNLARRSSTSSTFDYKEAMRHSVMKWYDEVALYNNSNLIIPDADVPVVLHYTQMVWANSTHLGCAGVRYTTYSNTSMKLYNYLIGCNYGYTGNRIGTPIYKIGKPCSKCDNRRTCNAYYKSLCGKNVSVADSTRGFHPFFSL